jgi:predicted nucleic acid-binding protein
LTVYLDTSVVVPMFIRDDHTDRVKRWATTRPLIATSAWVATEFSSALSLQHRMKRLTSTEWRRAEAAFDAWAVNFRQFELEARHVVEARRLIVAHGGLRAPDALHLALAAAAGMSLATLDTGLREAARAERVEVVEL